jgi:serine/threonine-protein kinase RsbW
VRTNSEQLTNGNRADGVRPDQDEVVIRVPALRRYVSAVRSLTMSLAVQCDLTVDEIEDVQMSIDEACALLLPHVVAVENWLDLTFQLADGHLQAKVRIATGELVEIDRASLSWTVLAALCDAVDVLSDGRSLTISMTKLRETVGP